MAKRNGNGNSVTFYVCMVLSIALHNVRPGVADGDWMNDCGVCQCKWISSKKIADCKNKSLITVPRELSNELQVIDLSYNVIPELRRNEFKEANLPNLHKIFLKNCTLQEIHRDAFKDLNLLIELDLSNNLLKVLDVGLFTDLIRLRTFTAAYNQIEQLDDNLFVNMTFLAKIEMQHNRLHFVGLRTFVNVPTMKEIDLQSNQLSVLKEDTFRDLVNLNGLTLYDNPWNCTCELQQFQRYVLGKGLYTKPTSCHEPMELRGKFWSDVPSENFACRPRIFQPRDGATIDATSENATITCRMKGSPKPEVVWTYNGQPLSPADERISIKNSLEINRRDSADIYTSELIIVGVKPIDRGTYTCIASNTGGKAKADVQLAYAPVSEVIGGLGIIGSTAGIPTTNPTNLLLIICLIAIILLSLLIIIVLILCCYCRRVKKYSKNGSISENGLVSSKIDRSQDGSMLEGSVIMEMQKSLLTEVNPVEKPPRRNEIDGKSVSTDEGHDVKKTLLDEHSYGEYNVYWPNLWNENMIPVFSTTGNHDDETHSVSLSDTTPRSRATFVDDGYGTNLPPDLLSFPSRFPQSPSTQSSISNIPDGNLYIKSPVASPIYQHNPYGIAHPGFRTLQHPKNRNLAIINRNNSPFQPAPILYAPIVMKQGYVTIPRKPRTPSWAPSIASTMIDFPPTSPTSTMSTELAIDPIYDNLGLRTTASGHSVLSLNKQATANAAAAAGVAAVAGISGVAPVTYTMKDRPLPATPLIFEPIQEQQLASMMSSDLSGAMNDETELLFNKSIEPHPIIVSVNAINNNSLSNNNISTTHSNNNTLEKSTSKVPPRPPPKPKKKMPTISAITENPELHASGDGTKLYEDECEDGTEV